MKIRTAFVANSSSSSFLVRFPKPASTVQEVMDKWIPELGPAMGDEYDRGEVYTKEQIAEAMLRSDVHTIDWELYDRVMAAPTVKEIVDLAKQPWTYEGGDCSSCDDIKGCKPGLAAKLKFKQDNKGNKKAEHSWWGVSSCPRYSITKWTIDQVYDYWYHLVKYYGGDKSRGYCSSDREFDDEVARAFGYRNDQELRDAQNRHYDAATKARKEGKKLKKSRGVKFPPSHQEVMEMEVNVLIKRIDQFKEFIAESFDRLRGDGVIVKMEFSDNSGAFGATMEHSSYIWGVLIPEDRFVRFSHH